MDTKAFEDRLRAEGYTEIMTRTVDKAMQTPLHTHPFDAFAMILDGEMSVVCGDKSVTCHAGDTFQLAAGLEHFESYGEKGATYLVGRRMAPAKAA